MTWRFRRSIQVVPGIRLNLAKRGVSLSAGGHGFTRNFNAHGARTTVGLPGTGLSYSTRRRRSGGSTLGGLIFLLALGMLLAWGFGWL